MARKIFVSYKHKDTEVYPVEGGQNNTARDYVDVLEKLFEGEEIYKGERSNQDLSTFTNGKIKSKLRDQIFDSSVTIVLVSRGMKVNHLEERDQFIPWEIAYSIQRRKRGERRSDTNAILLVVIPNLSGSYSHFIQEGRCGCGTTMLMTGDVFSIIRKNIFNRKQIEEAECSSCTSYTGPHSYMPYVKWSDFVLDPNRYIQRAIDRRETKHEYNLYKRIV